MKLGLPLANWKGIACAIACVLGIGFTVSSAVESDYDYIVVDTGHYRCYDDNGQIPCPQPGEPFYGQDAQYYGPAFSFQDNGDGTVTDLNTDLMWQQTPDFDNKLTWAAALTSADTFELAGYDDWRLPTIKELYSLIDFNGSATFQPPVPYIDTTYFAFEWGDTTAGERLIDAQYWSSTGYVGTVMNGDAAAFGVNFADGRIKGYPTETGPGPDTFKAFVRYVRAGDGYGVNDFVDNGDGTITDLSTGLTWMKGDCGTTLNWEEALAYAENLDYAGYDDWRLPNTKELQSIVDYTRAPDAINPLQQGPAIDPIFEITEEESYFWTGTTHLDRPGDFAAYIAFGQAWGYMGPPGFGEWMNVHGAGAQRSDPKSGDPNAWPYGLGPQGDEIRIYNYVRCVRGGPSTPPLNVHVALDTTEVSPGDALWFTVDIENTTSNTLTFDTWMDGYLPNGNPYSGNPVLGPVELTLDPGFGVYGVRRHIQVPPGAPYGEPYGLCIRTGMHPECVWAEDCVEFAILPAVAE